MAEYRVRKERIEPLWDRVDRNRVRLALFVLLFLVASALGLDIVLALVLVALLFLGNSPEWWILIVENLQVMFTFSSGLAIVGAGAYAAFALSRSERWLLERFAAVIVPKGELLPTKYALKDMAIAAGYEVAPALYLMETNNVNAFAFGHSDRRAVIGVTRGLVERLEIDEQRAVFANLMARLRVGDTMWATGVTALMHPLWAIREKQFRTEGIGELGTMVLESENQAHPMTMRPSSGSGSAMIIWYMLVAWVFVIVSEIILAGHRSSHLRHSETSDAEAMLLLKDPKSMLSALEKSVRFNNFVPTAGPGFTLLFFSYTGDDTDDESDPEMRRVSRLREVLGVEGMADGLREQNARVLEVPVAPAFSVEIPGMRIADKGNGWSVRSNSLDRAAGWLTILQVTGAVVVAAVICWLAMVFDASLPRAYSSAYDAVPIGNVFRVGFGLFGLVCACAPLASALLDGRLSVALGSGVASAAIWTLATALSFGPYSGSPSWLLYVVGVMALFSGAAGYWAGRVFEGE